MKFRRTQSTGDILAVGETAIWEREWRTYQALKSVLGEQPCTINGRYSWLQSPLTGRPLQIDIFYHSLMYIGDTKFRKPRVLAVEVQSSLHDGKWNPSKKRFFKSKQEFEHYTANQAAKAAILRDLGIPLLEIDPDVDSLHAPVLTRSIRKILGIA